ncbi:hypothetical protein EDD15DRAFT_2376675 [Pisolithus albus]|nr:hypothetical protein EDD15DRAFT_2376675 [Pisolithus albus]
MSTSKTTTHRQPIYIPPDIICEQIPNKWEKLMSVLASVMREIPSEVAEDHQIREWMGWFEEVSAQIEELQQFTAGMSTEVPEYPEEAKEAVLSRLLTLAVLRNRLDGKAKVKAAPAAPRDPEAGGEVRRSHHQQEKTAAEGGGSKDATRAANTSVGGETSATPLAAPQATPEPVAVVDNQALTQQSIDQPPPGEGGACEACHEGKKRCDKAGKPGKKRKNTEGLPASSASMNKKAKMTPDPSSSSAPSKVTLKVRPRVIGKTGPPAATTSPSVALQDVPTPAASPPRADPLFLPSSRASTPLPANDVPMADTAAFGTSISGVLEDQTQPADAVEEIDLTTPRASPSREEPAPLPSKGKDQTDPAKESPSRSPFEELDTRIEAIEDSIEWGEETLAGMHAVIACLATDASEVGGAIQRAKR